MTTTRTYYLADVGVHLRQQPRALWLEDVGIGTVAACGLDLGVQGPVHAVPLEELRVDSFVDPGVEVAHSYFGSPAAVSDRGALEGVDPTAVHDLSQNVDAAVGLGREEEIVLLVLRVASKNAKAKS